MPLSGGMAVGLVVSAAGALLAAVYPSASSFYKAFIPAALLILASGLWDDVCELAVTGKIITQVAATALLVLLGVRTRIVFLNEPLNIIITFAWVLFITNSFNLLDIMDGLCASVTGIIASGLLIVCLLNGDIGSARLIGIIAGSAAGFLVLNRPEASIYLGNSGSHFLGFVLAAVSIELSYASASRQAALISPVFIMGFPIFDTFFVAVMRMANGRSAVRKSKDHLVLRFLALGHSKRRALIFMSSLAFLFTACGVVMSCVPNSIGAGVIIFVMFVSFIVWRAMSRVRING
ncbi:MAG TPA: MraY family glycosyltransferase [Candidatus Omnitrophota bacterium]|nr:MraY family glycosyltransferase [Candidatus Omnitrophota bacterium]HQO38774.1 MraY family glycosyltransferase [Candidatus Omnitrophota bacterium]